MSGRKRTIHPCVDSATGTGAFTDYYPFGFAMPGRQYITGSPYRFGYQGQFAEKDEETGLNHFEARSYDSRIGRWLTTDPADHDWSPYVGMGNNWPGAVDPDGRWPEWVARGFQKIFGGELTQSIDGNNLTDNWGLKWKNKDGDYVHRFKGVPTNFKFGPMTLGISFEIAYAKEMIYQNKDIGFGFSLGLASDNEGVSPYFIRKKLSNNSDKNIAFGISIDFNYFDRYDGETMYNNDLIGDGLEHNLTLIFGGASRGVGLNPSGKAIVRMRGIHAGIGIDFGNTWFDTSTSVPFRLNNNWSITKFK